MSDVFEFWFIVFVVMAIYPLPIYVAAVRKTANQSWVLLINLFLGWTVIGWFAAAIMAAEGKKK